MRVIKFQLIIAFIVGLATYVIVSIIEGKFSALGLISGIFSFLITLTIDILLVLKEISGQLHLERNIRDIDNPILRLCGQKLVQKNLEVFKELEQGIIRFDSESEMMDIYYTVFFKERSKRILATSMVNINQVWATARGKRALKENIEAIKRGITIQRIFIFPNEDKKDDNDTKIHLKLQDEAGVDVWQVIASDLDRGLRRDFCVTDSNIVLEYKMDVEGNIIECILSSGIGRANEFRDIHAKILAASEHFNQ